MARVRTHSRVSDELPPEVRREVDRLLVEDNVTYDDITAYLAGKGHDISRSAIGRYGKEFVGRYKELRIVEDQSRTLVSEAGEGMIIEEAASKLFAGQIAKLLIAGDLDVKAIPRLVSDFAKLQASSILRERLKMEFRSRVEETAKDVEKVARSGGLTAEKVEEIKRKILGIV